MGGLQPFTDIVGAFVTALNRSDELRGGRMRWWLVACLKERVACQMQPGTRRDKGRAVEEYLTGSR
jgi:hypothetical protein